MEIYILPVSGKYFPNQLALLNLVLESNSYPRICMGSSGGNMVGYMGLFGEWKPSEIRKNMPKLSSDIFIDKKQNQVNMGIVRGTFGKSMYDHSTSDIVEKLFSTSPQLIRNTEMWTGTFNILQGKSHNFCNLSESESILKNNPSSNYLFGYMNHEYLSGHTDMIHRTSRASATLPIILPPISIKDEPYIDGGVGYPSPFYPFRDQINNIKEQEQVMITYFGCCNRKKNISIKGGNAIDSLKETAFLVYNSLCISEYAAILEMVGPGKEKISDGEITLKEAIELRKKYKFSVLYIWPRYNMSLTLVNFKTEEVFKIYEFCYKNYNFELWFDRKNLIK